MVLKNFVLVLIFCLICKISAWTPKPNPKACRVVKGTTIVLGYNLTFSLDSKTVENDSKVKGRSILTFKKFDHLGYLSLHADMNITSRTITLKYGSSLTIKNLTEPGTTQMSHMEFIADTQVKQLETYEAEFEYLSRISENDYIGFCRDYYKDFPVISVNFEPIYARKYFPCIDEPEYKTSFKLIINHSRKYNVLGSTRLVSADEDNDLIRSEFASTPLMSTFLVKFVLYNKDGFNCTEQLHEENEKRDVFLFGVCSSNETVDNRELALSWGYKLLKAFGHYTNLPFNITKIKQMHLFAVPKVLKFDSGASWALATFSEDDLLYDPQTSSHRLKQKIIQQIAQTLTFIWFENLVTEEWWNITYINKGLAAYFAQHIPQQVDPSLELDRQFAIDTMQNSFSLDEIQEPSVLVTQAETPDEIITKFSNYDFLSKKAACLFRMVAHTMGVNNFRTAIQKYLAANLFNTTTENNFWIDGIQTVDPTMRFNLTQWTKEPGFPMIHVRIYSKPQVQIIQRRFLSSTPNSRQNVTPTVWYIPLSYTKSTDKNPHKFKDTKAKPWSMAKSQVYNCSVLEEDDWIIFNNQRTGYYRVNYEDNLLRNIEVALNKPGFDGIHELNRAQIVDDLFYMAKYDYNNYQNVLNVYKFLSKETSYYTWKVAFDAFTYMLDNIDTDDAEKLLAYIRKLIVSVFNSVSFNDAKDYDHMYSLKRTLVMSMACKFRMEECEKYCRPAFQNYRFRGIKPEKNLRSLVYCYGPDPHDNTVYDFFKSQFAKLDEEERDILAGITCSESEEVLEEVVSNSARGEYKKKHIHFILKSVYSRPQGASSLLKYFMQNTEFHHSFPVSWLLDNLVTKLQLSDIQTCKTLFLNSVGRLSYDQYHGLLEPDKHAHIPNSLHMAMYKAFYKIFEVRYWRAKLQEEVNYYFNVSSVHLSSNF